MVYNIIKRMWDVFWCIRKENKKKGQLTMKDKTKLKIAYIGGGSKGWAWQLMRELQIDRELGGELALYDIDYEAAKRNEVIAGKITEIAQYYDSEGEVDEAHERWEFNWKCKAYKTIDEALSGADFVVISIMPGTLDEMQSDVHTPEKYGIYQSVGDTVGPGGIIRALRTIPMFEEFAKAIKKNCHDAWVINYTNPMTVCVRTLYKVFPQIKAFGCCHEVFGTQKLLCDALEDIKGIEKVKRHELCTNVAGVNHFTWITKANYGDIDLYDVYGKFVDKYYETGFVKNKDNNWANAGFGTAQRVKMDLFKRYNCIAAAGDRHLAEFNPGYHYLKNPQQVNEWMFELTSVEKRREDEAKRQAESDKLFGADGKFGVWDTGEEGVTQMKALLGLGDLVTNINIPNYGQIPNLPLGVVVETNGAFRNNSLEPVFAGNIPTGVHALVKRVVDEQELVIEAGLERDLNKAFRAFAADPLVTIPLADAKALFDEMLENTKSYLTDY